VAGVAVVAVGGSVVGADDDEAVPPAGHRREQPLDVSVDILQRGGVRRLVVAVDRGATVHVEPVRLVDRRHVDEEEQWLVVDARIDDLLGDRHLILE
jgi:hypothetical protein